MIVAGTYQGSIQDNKYGPGSVSFSLTQSGTLVTGSFTDSFAACGVTQSGSLSGTLTGNSLQALVVPIDPHLTPLVISGEVQGSQIQGFYFLQDSSMYDEGTFYASSDDQTRLPNAGLTATCLPGPMPGVLPAVA